MQKYTYRGPVLSFGKLISNQWEAETFASSKAKAKSNFAYQYKKKAKILPGSKIELPGKIDTLEETYESRY